MLRGPVQIVVVGSMLVFLIRGPRWTAVILLAVMIAAAGATSARRARRMPGAFAVSTWSIACGAGSVIALMTLPGVIDTAITSLVPVGSMIIANAMNANGLALNRFRSDVLAHVGEVETALALGAEAATSVSPYVQSSFEASLIPAIDSIRSLGIVWIPGLMAGMLVSGASPIDASIYQFVALSMILSTLLIRGRIFSAARPTAAPPRRLGELPVRVFDGGLTISIALRNSVAGYFAAGKKATRKRCPAALPRTVFLARATAQ